jgi:hypothetical protein
MISLKRLMFVPVVFVLALLPCESRGQQTGTFSNLNLKKTGSAPGEYAFRFAASDGILKAYNSSGEVSSSWDPETGNISANLDLSECFILTENNEVSGDNDFTGANKFSESVTLYGDGGAKIEFSDPDNETTGRITYFGGNETGYGLGAFSFNKPISGGVTISAGNQPYLELDAADWGDAATFIYDGDNGQIFSDRPIEAPGLFATGYVLEPFPAVFGRG